jgi:hypothetical protein
MGDAWYVQYERRQKPTVISDHYCIIQVNQIYFIISQEPDRSDNEGNSNEKVQHTLEHFRLDSEIFRERDHNRIAQSFKLPYQGVIFIKGN